MPLFSLLFSSLHHSSHRLFPFSLRIFSVCAPFHSTSFVADFCHPIRCTNEPISLSLFFCCVVLCLFVCFCCSRVCCLLCLALRLLSFLFFCRFSPPHHHPITHHVLSFSLFLSPSSLLSRYWFVLTFSRKTTLASAVACSLDSPPPYVALL